MAHFKILKASNLIQNFPECEGFLIAYSGGADSTTLLHLFSQEKNIRAIHINHGLQKDANKWQSHCQNTCNQLGIKLVVEQAQLNNASENSCRLARYDFFEKHLQENEILLTAHHCQDQAETILLKLLRGTGIKGLGGIDSIRKFSQGYIARPLLQFSPETLKDYLVSNNLQWIEDSSNLNNRYKRNYIRNEILPRFKNEFTKPLDNIVRSADNTRQSLNLLNHLIDFQGKALPIKALRNLPQTLQPTLLYHWLSQKNVLISDKKTLAQITHDFIHAKSDKQPRYKNKHYQLVRGNNHIYCIRNYQIMNANKTFTWDTDTLFSLPNDYGFLKYHGDDKLILSIKYNQTAQKIKPFNHTITKSIKNLFNENKLPIWGKQNTPFIYLNNDLISLGHKWSHTKKAQNTIELIHYKNFIL